VSKSIGATAVAKAVPIGFVYGPDMTGRCSNSEAAKAVALISTRLIE
jgi:hypothetical protein